MNYWYGRDLVRKNTAHWSKIINDYKLKRGCEECGYNTHAVALDFKLFSIGNFTKRAINNGNHDILLAEMAKCRILCACCHRIKTHAAMEWLRQEKQLDV